MVLRRVAWLASDMIDSDSAEPEPEWEAHTIARADAILATEPGEADDCPRCRSYDCAGHHRPADCGHAFELALRHEMSDHRFCTADGCEWAREVRPLVLAAGAGRGNDEDPLAVVVVGPSGRALYSGRRFRDHRLATPCRTRLGGGAFDAKARVFIVCARCGSLH